tara:strand:- start:831 stop:1280 length:450 start_codon:yes stop_codon:yes gene_type:complete
MKITYNKEEKLQLIRYLFCTNHDYFRENYLLLDWNEKDYKASKTRKDKSYEDTLLNMLKNGYEIILQDDYVPEDEEGEIVARFNLKELFNNLDNPQIDDNYYSSLESFSDELLSVMLSINKDYDTNWDSVTMTRIASVLFYHENTWTRK